MLHMTHLLWQVYNEYFCKMSAAIEIFRFKWFYLLKRKLRVGTLASIKFFCKILILVSTRKSNFGVVRVLCSDNPRSGACVPFYPVSDIRDNSPFFFLFLFSRRISDFPVNTIQRYTIHLAIFFFFFFFVQILFEIALTAI